MSGHKRRRETPPEGRIRHPFAHPHLSPTETDPLPRREPEIAMGSFSSTEVNAGQPMNTPEAQNMTPAAEDLNFESSAPTLGTIDNPISLDDESEYAHEGLPPVSRDPPPPYVSSDGQPSIGSSSSSAHVSFHSAVSSIANEEGQDDFLLAVRLQEEEAQQHRTATVEDADYALAQLIQNQYDEEQEFTNRDEDVAMAFQDEEEQRRLRESRPEERTCAICSEELHPLEFPAKPPTSECTHKVNTCSHCLEKWVAADLEGRGWQHVSCPECRRPFSHADMKRAANDDTFERYDKLSARAVVGDIQNFHWCVAAGCGSGQVHEGDENGENPIFDCGQCGHRQCVKHKVAWHENETCDEYDYRISGNRQRDQENQASEETAARTTQICPNQRCKSRIEKRSGCDHMTCE
ncbi:hypothetical protein NA57DRAFT_77639 [Rhizodiscina lignyota]|uniref:RBR-type E3 ubiquitin transferase n=1 Tax=Rhizodiscina lignyota TaxID=1504668 RepID=A0A9P4IF57_9PEZI|nr:hypothetical protein NA57DRAFT_77639 [Rhizodiscina lignyota]